MLGDESLFEDPRRAVNLGVGFASPLWPTFIAAASAGVAYWAWTQWARSRATHEFAVLSGQPLISGLEAAAPPASTIDTPPADRPEPAAEAVLALAEPAVERLDESLVPSAETLVAEPAPEPEPAAIEAAAVSETGPAIEAPHEPTVIEAVAPEAEAPPQAPRKAKALASTAIPDPDAPPRAPKRGRKPR